MSGKNTIKKHINIWIWLQDNKIVKAITCIEDGTIRIYDEQDNLILKRTGLTIRQVKIVEKHILRYGAKKLDAHAEPFKFL